MASEVRSYNPGKLVVIAGGVPLTGFADGTFINIEAVTDGVTSQAGADGEIARAISTDKRQRVTLTFQQTSRANLILSGFQAADSISGAGIMFPLYIQDLLGSMQFVVAQAWVVKKATRTYSKGIENREWVIETGEPAIDLLGGTIA